VISSETVDAADTRLLVAARAAAVDAQDGVRSLSCQISYGTKLIPCADENCGMATTRTDIDDLFSRLTVDHCQYCEGGTLSRGIYKGAPAVVCDDCGTPALRVW
jgi:hypothetical protein